MLNDRKRSFSATMRSLLTTILLLALFPVGSALGAGTGHPEVLLGDTAVQWRHDSLAAGEADAFRLRAKTSGLAAAVHVYMDAGTSARRLIVGLYSSVPGRPGTLLSTGSASPARGTWTSVSIAPVEILTGRTYWLAILGRGGRLRYRDRAQGRCPSATSAKRNLRALSRSWRTGTTDSACPVSAYVTPVPGGADLTSPLNDATAALEQAAGTSALEQPTGTPPAAPVAVAPPVIYGEPTEGKKLTASEGTWSGEPTSYVYQWEDCDTSGEACLNIAGATSSSYKLRPGDVGYRIRVAVTAANAVGSAKASSEATAAVLSSASAGPQVFVSQAGAGGQSGEGGCGNAHSLAWLNNASNWGSGAGRVAPGTTVDLCGVFTQPLETRGSGTNGKPITMLFTSGAKIAMSGSGCPGSGCIDISNGSEYITIDGGGEGVIENTERSYAKEKEEGPPTTGIVAKGCRHCSIENLEIGPLYVSEKGDVVGNTEIRGIESDPEGGTPEYITVEDDVFHDMGWAVTIQTAETTSHVYVEQDTFYHLTHGFTPGSNFNGGSVGPIVFAHNRFFGNSNWEDGADTNHVDGVHCFGGQGKTAHYTGLYIYDNYITAEGTNTTGPIFLEGTNGGTPCSDKTSNVWIFNNVLTGNTCCGLAGAFTGEDHTYNNTLIGEGPTTEEGEKETCESWNSDTKEGRLLAVSNRTFKNNVVTSCHNLISAERFLAAPNGVEHNLWANAGGGNEVFACEHGEVESGAEDKEAFRSSEFSSWVKCMEQPETESRYVSTAKLELTGQAQAPLGEPESGSEAIGHGKNLSSLCSQTPEEALCKNIDGEARPSSGPWNIGAY